MKLWIWAVVGSAVAGLASIAAVPAQAGSAPPCGRLLAADAAGDATRYLTPGAGFGFGFTSAPAPENMDLVGFAVERKPRPGGRPRTTIDLVVRNLATALPESMPTGVRYTLEFDTVGDVTWARATLRDGEFSFTYGEVQRLPGSVPRAGGQGYSVNAEPTTGRIVEGASGVIQIDVPDDVGWVDGTVLTGMEVTVAAEGYRTTDRLPDRGSTDATVQTCAVPPPPPAPKPPAPKPPKPDGDGQGNGNGNSNGNGNGNGQGNGKPRPKPPSGTTPAQPKPGQGEPATPAQPANGKAVRRGPSCQAKANRLKSKAKRRAASRRCKAAARRRG